MLVRNVKQVSAEELLKMAEAARGKINTIFLHWTACAYGQVFDDYHLCIGKDGNIDAPSEMFDLAEVKAHTWMRNAGAVGIAIEAARGAKIDGEWTINYGKKSPPTEEQIKGLALAVAIICKGAGIPIDKDTVMTHAEIADVDGYGVYDTDPDMRWDLLRLPFASGVSGGEYIRSLASAKLEDIEKR
ncbi:MAG: N-acetylmuramoyl-L-alanine amidase [Phascolarctobacterium sp.]|nr:N-acetylmuramoyl-L-alanine amidase [Phascolarctobacterium sp.]